MFVQVARRKNMRTPPLNCKASLTGRPRPRRRNRFSSGAPCWYRGGRPALAAAPPCKMPFLLVTTMLNELRPRRHHRAATEVVRACHALLSACGTSTKGAQISQPRATPWVSREKRQSPERAVPVVPPFQGSFRDGRFSQGGALGWLVAGPLALSSYDCDQSA